MVAAISDTSIPAQTDRPRRRATLGSRRRRSSFWPTTTRPLIDRDRKLSQHCVVTLRLHEERFEICWADVDRIQHADM